MSLKYRTIGATAIMLFCGLPSLAAAQSAFGLANNDSIYVDATSFKVVPGKAKGEPSALVEKLGAQELGAGAIIFRSGNRLYIADAPPVRGASFGSDRYGGSRNDYGSDRYGGSRNDYGSDRYGGSRNDYGSDRYGGSRNDYGSDRYGGSRNDYGSDRYSGSRNDYGSDRYGGSRNDYGSDRYGGSRNDYGSDRYGGDRVIINDPDYAQYKLKKIFEDNWTAGESK